MERIWFPWNNIVMVKTETANRRCYWLLHERFRSWNWPIFQLCKNCSGTNKTLVAILRITEKQCPADQLCKPIYNKRWTDSSNNKNENNDRNYRCCRINWWIWSRKKKRQKKPLLNKVYAIGQIQIESSKFLIMLQ